MSADRLARHRARQWAALQPALTRTPALSEHAGKPHRDYPIVSPAEMRDDYGRWNSLGLGDAALRALADAAEGGEQPGPVSVGWSTGSSGGPRGLFVADEAERADYLGQSLARLLTPRELLRRQRLALHLRASSTLYSDVGNRRFAFAHLPLEAAISNTVAALTAFAPTILVAPPYRLLALADAGVSLPGLRHLFYGSEPMSEAECAHVAARIGLTPRAIYQAAEGFLGGACHFERLHLNDHALEIESEGVPGTPGFRPIISDLRRRSQPIVRMMGDDYFELGEQGCDCGFAGRVIAPIEGRVGDIWRLNGKILPPPRIVEAVESVLSAIHRWQARASRREVRLRTARDCPPALQSEAARRLSRLVGENIPLRVEPDLAPWPGPKRHKVVWDDG